MIPEYYQVAHIDNQTLPTLILVIIIGISLFIIYHSLKIILGYDNL